MSDITPNPSVPPFEAPPITYETAPDPVLQEVPLNPPFIGTAGPFNRVDGQNRDTVVAAIRAWFRKVFLPWLAAWTAFWTEWRIGLNNDWNAFRLSIQTWLNAWAAAQQAWMDAVEEYISENTINSVAIGTVTTGAQGTNATATLSGTKADIVFSFSIPRGYAGYSWKLTESTIAESGSSTVTVASSSTRPLSVDDIILTTDGLANYGIVTSVTNSTTAVVSYVGNLRGPAGIAELGSVSLGLEALALNDVQSGLLEVPQMIGAFKITTTARCWVRIYASEAHLIADAARDINTPINVSSDHGVYLDYVSTPTSLVKTLSPGVMISNTGDGVWYSIQNTFAGASTIGVDLDYRIFKE